MSTKIHIHAFWNYGVCFCFTLSIYTCISYLNSKCFETLIKRACRICIWIPPPGTLNHVSPFLRILNPSLYLDMKGQHKKNCMSECRSCWMMGILYVTPVGCNCCRNLFKRNYLNKADIIFIVYYWYISLNRKN